ncbi:MAG: hypothetical protein M1820_003286 [Bogoriella megaspora]|nr:MAG: hypothetical protein M1820_003286 [Bogoriella megaspora]
MDPLEYARFYGLSRDLSKENALKEACLHIQPVHKTQSLCDLANDSMLIDEEAFIHPKEKITLDRDAVAYLQWISLLPQKALSTEQYLQGRRQYYSQLRLELPLLKTDHELDIRALQPAHPLDVVYEENLPPEELNNESDESLHWSVIHYELPALYGSQIKGEKISVARESLLYLQSSIIDAFTDQDEQSIIGVEINDNRRRTLLEPITPPLMPISPPYEPYVPSSPIATLQLLSESTDAIAKEARHLEQEMFRDDVVGPNTAPEDADSMLLDDGDEGHGPGWIGDLNDKPSSLPAERARREDLKVEEPLVASITLNSPGRTSKSVSFRETLEEVIPELPSAQIDKDDLLGSDTEFSKYFNGTIRPLAEEAERGVRGEQLRQGGNTQRLEVPALDMTIASPPWEEFAQRPGDDSIGVNTDLQAHRRLMGMVKHEYLKTEMYWSGVSKLERRLPWSPFPAHLAKFPDEESIIDDGSLEELMKELTFGEKIDSASLTWKPEGLRVFGESDDEEELEEGDFPEDMQDMHSLLRKRKLEIEDEDQASRRRTTKRATGETPRDPASNQGDTRGQQSDPALGKTSANKPPHDSGLMFGGMFSATTALHNYMSVHGAATKDKSSSNSAEGLEPVLSKAFMFKTPELKTHKTFDLGDGGKNVQQIRQDRDLKNLPNKAKEDAPRSLANSTSFSYPDAPIPETRTPFVINSQAVTQRQLFRRIEQLFPAADFIERDFSSEGHIHQTMPSSVIDADIILSPSTAVIWTTMQKIRQRPLPGQAAQNAVKERIAAIVGRYEKVVVLVSEGAVVAPMAKMGSMVDPRKCGEGGEIAVAKTLDQRDCFALADLTAFAMEVDGDVGVVYVPGGQVELARWVVGLMAQFGATQGQRMLLQEETLWELFLRRAGMNAYAAQVVLSELKPSDNLLNGTQNDGSNGLAAIVRMSCAERIQKFETLLGGRKLLMTVSQVFDKKWLSNSGYQRK